MSEPHPENPEEEVSAEIEKEVSAEITENREQPTENLALRRHQLSASIEFTGPLPHPRILRQYNDALTNGADRIMAMTEREQEHRHRMQEKLVEAQIADQQREREERKRGQTFGLLIGLFAVAAGSLTAILDHPWVGGGIGSAGVIGLVSVFVSGRIEQKKSQELKSSDIEDEPGSI